jgi:hypothetical protein
MNKIVYLKWVDSTSWEGWKNLPLTDSKMCEIETIGYVIKETKKKIVIAHSISNANHTNGILSIPKGALLKRRNIK